jgi:hypothetical protein
MMALGAAVLVAELLQILIMLTTYRAVVAESVYTAKGQVELLPQMAMVAAVLMAEMELYQVMQI